MLKLTKEHEKKDLGYCKKCGRAKNTYTKHCVECLQFYREAKFKKYGHLELIEK
jgi:hypothetical protein